MITLDLAIAEIQKLRDFYEYQIRDFQPYFKEKKQKSDERLLNLKSTLIQLDIVLKLINQ